MRVFVMLVSILGYPATILAQAAIVGTVTDSFGTPIDGVTIEASGPELIEKIRTAATDGTGRYRIENLRPGIYTVTFRLDGWSPLQRQAIELTGSFTATVDFTWASWYAVPAVSGR